MTPDELSKAARRMVSRKALTAASALSPAAVNALRTLAQTYPMRNDPLERWATARYRLPDLNEAGITLAHLQELGAHGFAPASGYWHVTAEGISTLRALGLLAPGWPRVVAKDSRS